ncbi:MAG: fluoride efflux transporter CrcB [Alphaproteobacteria bacterium]
MTGFLAVALGGALGASLRYGAGLLIVRMVGGVYPWPTLFVNVIGSFLMGAMASFLLLKGSSDEMRLFLLTGLLGGFTTYSAFSLETLHLWERGEGGIAALYMIGKLLVCFVAVLAGARLIRAFA